ncbi:MAG: DNA-3-methyladenine glycosylase [Gammaproteobacteria bacterium]
MPSKDSEAGTGAAFTLACRAPFDWNFLLDFYRARAIDGVERVDGRRYVRVVRAGTDSGIVSVAAASDQALCVTLSGLPASVAGALAEGLRSAFDLTTDPHPIHAHLACDPLLRPLIEARPGLRIPGCVDPFEQGVRAILGQQISVGAARQLAARLCARWGNPVIQAHEPTLVRAFPTPAALADADIASLGMPRARGRSVSAFATAVLDDPDLLTRGATLDDSLGRLLRLPGIGPWSAHYIAMRALREPDAFPASDVGILRALTGADRIRPNARHATARAECWRPWRAYAAQYLWSADSAVGLRSART